MKKLVKLDIGCGPNKKQGYVGIDCYKYDGVDIIIDLDKQQIPYENNTIEEIFSSHFLEHSTKPINILKEVNRLLAPNSIATIIVPHYSNPYAKHFTHSTYWCSYSLSQEYLDYYVGKTLILIGTKIRFVYPFGIGIILGKIFNLNLSIYEWLFCPFIKAWEIEFTLTKNVKRKKTRQEYRLH